MTNEPFRLQVNGEIEKKDDSGNETGADQEVEHDDQAYDKNKSFFDNISCEAVERSKGKTPRTDWRQERKINSETFGYSFNRRGMKWVCLWFTFVKQKLIAVSF